MTTITMKDGTRIYYKDWGAGQPIVFSHGWPLSADAWEDQMYFLASHGFRCIAHDRRGHGRSSQPWTGTDMDTYADDLVAVIALDLDHAIFHGAAGSAKALELAGELFQCAFRDRNTLYGRDGLPATVTGFAAHPHDAVAARHGFLRACWGYTTDAGRVDDSVVARAHAAKHSSTRRWSRAVSRARSEVRGDLEAA